MTSTLKLVKQVINHGDVILILDCDLVQLSIVNEILRELSFFFTNNTGAPHGEILGLMKPSSRRSFNFSICFLCSTGVMRNSDMLGIWKEINSKVDSLGRSFGNTSGNSLTIVTDSKS